MAKTVSTAAKFLGRSRTKTYGTKQQRAAAARALVKSYNASLTPEERSAKAAHASSFVWKDVPYEARRKEMQRRRLLGIIRKKRKEQRRAALKQLREQRKAVIQKP